jgi:hypothetical protein
MPEGTSHPELPLNAWKARAFASLRAGLAASVRSVTDAVAWFSSSIDAALHCAGLSSIVMK